MKDLDTIEREFAQCEYERSQLFFAFQCSNPHTIDTPDLNARFEAIRQEGAIYMDSLSAMNEEIRTGRRSVNAALPLYRQIAHNYRLRAQIKAERVRRYTLAGPLYEESRRYEAKVQELYLKSAALLDEAIDTIRNNRF